MAYINLLPWREEAQKAKQKQFFTILAAVALFVIAIGLLVGQFYQMRIDGQNARNQFLTNEITLLDQRIAEIKTLNDRKSDLQKRMDVIEQLQLSRNVGTQVLDEIAKVVPVGIYLTRMEKQGNVLQLFGKSESNNHLANMIRAIEGSDLFDNAVLESITNKDETNKLLSDFKMKVTIKGLLATTTPTGGK
ncbi:PilN domain-containing protein [Endozoicomonas sp. G2_1]|uniref:PilN domain-containing protein n=1 Tax=Endozoicomonas sp. G2_1 TaxID=2821091 RepID=UPI001ADCCC48|nr:PilN domain-containing protein [Endozoicomonas sp. G2_1]MBO9491555.1 PilN domain-containing protein [Endozoicomonas sp. G2_1]